MLLLWRAASSRRAAEVPFILKPGVRAVFGLIQYLRYKDDILMIVKNNPRNIFMLWGMLVEKWNLWTKMRFLFGCYLEDNSSHDCG